MAAMGEMPWNKLLAQSVCLFLNRHWQFGVYPSKIQVTHIPTNPIRVDFTSQHPCPPWLCSLLSFCLSNRWKWVLACFSAPFPEDEGGWASFYLFRFHSVSWRAWVGGALLFIVHICVWYLYQMARKNVYIIQHFQFFIDGFWMSCLKAISLILLLPGLFRKKAKKKNSSRTFVCLS